jgi:hypothetical protein
MSVRCRTVCSFLPLVVAACGEDAAPQRYAAVSDAAAPVVGVPVGSPGPSDDDELGPMGMPSATSMPTAVPNTPGSRLPPPGTEPVPTASGSATAPIPGGSAGGAGSGGAASVGGAANAGTSSDAGVVEPADPGDYAVVCQDGNQGVTSSAQFSVRLSLLNYTEELIPIDEVSVRYWFTSDNETEPSLIGHLVYVDDAGPTWGERDNVTTEIGEVDPAEAGADHYVEVGFGTANCGNCSWPTTPRGTVAPESRPTQLRVQIDPAALRYDLSDDHSYQPEADSPRLCDTITLYRNGRLIFGIEPDGTTVEPVTDAGVPVDAGPNEAGTGGADPEGGTGGGGGRGGDPSTDAGVPELDASMPVEPEPAPLPDAGPNVDASFGDAAP